MCLQHGKSLLDIGGGAYDTVDAFIRDDIDIIYLLFTASRSKKGKSSAKQRAYSKAKSLLDIRGGDDTVDMFIRDNVAMGDERGTNFPFPGRGRNTYT